MMIIAVEGAQGASELDRTGATLSPIKHDVRAVYSIFYVNALRLHNVRSIIVLRKCWICAPVETIPCNVLDSGD